MRCQEPDKMTITYRWWSHKLYLPHNIHSNRFEHLSTQLFGATYFSLTISSFGIFLKISVSYWYHCSINKIICHLGLLYDGNAYWVLVHVNFTLSKFWLILYLPIWLLVGCITSVAPTISDCIISFLMLVVIVISNRFYETCR